MSKRYNFTESFKSELYSQLDSVEVQWKKEKKLPNTDIIAPIDIIIMQDQKKWVLIELEIHRADPSNNIAKIAYWLSCPGKDYDITVIQVFSPHYNGKTGFKAKRKVSEHLGNLLVKEKYNQKYIPLSSTIMDKPDFERLYKAFRNGHSPSQEDIQTMRKMFKDYITQILLLVRV